MQRPWGSMESSQNSLDLLGDSMEFNGSPWRLHGNPMALHGTPWRLHGIPCTFHGIPFDSTEFDGVISHGQLYLVYNVSHNSGEDFDFFYVPLYMLFVEPNIDSQVHFTSKL